MSKLQGVLNEIKRESDTAMGSIVERYPIYLIDARLRLVIAALEKAIEQRNGWHDLRENAGYADLEEQDREIIDVLKPELGI